MVKEQKEIVELVSLVASKKFDKANYLMRFVNSITLANAHYEQIVGKSAGVSKETKQSYEVNLDSNINNLLLRMKNGSYHPEPVKRVYIPKPGSDKLRPLGIPSYEDKLVQSVMAKILEAIYEPKFLDCSYGFRPNRSCHLAIKDLEKTIFSKKVNYIVDCDIKGFFDNLSQEWLIKFLEHDISDKNFVKYIRRFLRSGIMDNGKLIESDKGTPQGGIVSPILANIYLHYVLDLWFEKFVKKEFRGEAYLVRYADDFVVLFQYESEANKFYQLLIDRLAKFGLEVATDKSKIMKFGRYSDNAESFDFLGFTFSNGKSSKGNYFVKVRTSKKKLKI